MMMMMMMALIPPVVTITPGRRRTAHFPIAWFVVARLACLVDDGLRQRCAENGCREKQWREQNGAGSFAMVGRGRGAGERDACNKRGGDDGVRAVSEFHCISPKDSGRCLPTWAD